MIYWLQEATIVGGQGGGPSWLLSAGVIGATVSLIGLILAQLRHTQTLRQTRELEAQRAHEAALQKYFERMGELLIEKELRRSPDERSDQKHCDKEHDDVRLTARAPQTLTVLQGLEPNRKRLLVLFLYEASLIQSGRTVVDLFDADLSCADLSGVDLKGASLRGANLRKADLSKTNLSECLNSARLVEYLEKNVEYLEKKVPSKVNLIECLKKSDPGKDGLSECMSKGDLIKCLENAGLIDKVDGSEANLQECLIKARLREANFIEKTNLSGANLSGARNLTQEQIDSAKGDEHTQLPDHLQRPEHWKRSSSEGGEE